MIRNWSFAKVTDNLLKNEVSDCISKLPSQQNLRCPSPYNFSNTPSSSLKEYMNEGLRSNLPCGAAIHKYCQIYANLLTELKSKSLTNSDPSIGRP